MLAAMAGVTIASTYIFNDAGVEGYPHPVSLTKAPLVREKFFRQKTVFVCFVQMLQTEQDLENYSLLDL